MRWNVNIIIMMQADKCGYWANQSQHATLIKLVKKVTSRKTVTRVNIRNIVDPTMVHILGALLKARTENISIMV